MATARSRSASWLDTLLGLDLALLGIPRMPGRKPYAALRAGKLATILSACFFWFSSMRGPFLTARSALIGVGATPQLR